jgi:hypothetical protein
MRDNDLDLLREHCALDPDSRLAGLACKQRDMPSCRGSPARRRRSGGGRAGGRRAGGRNRRRRAEGGLGWIDKQAWRLGSPCFTTSQRTGSPRLALSAWPIHHVSILKVERALSHTANTGKGPPPLEGQHCGMALDRL